MAAFVFDLYILISSFEFRYFPLSDDIIIIWATTFIGSSFIWRKLSIFSFFILIWFKFHCFLRFWNIDFLFLTLIKFFLLHLLHNGSFFLLSWLFHRNYFLTLSLFLFIFITISIHIIYMIIISKCIFNFIVSFINIIKIKWEFNMFLYSW